MPFFWGGFYDLFFFSKFFFNLRGISAGALSESKILKMSGHVRKPLKLGALYREAVLLRVETTADTGGNYNTALYLFLYVTTCHINDNDISSSRALGELL